MKNNTIRDAIAALQDGRLVVYPTDTLYALGADIYNIKSVRNVYHLKKRPFTQPLPVAVGDKSSISQIAYTNNITIQVVDTFLPGPLTIILPKKESVSSISRFSKKI